MKIDTKYYGEIDYTKVMNWLYFQMVYLVFPSTMTIFPSMEEDDSSLLILQSVDEPYVAFFLIDAAALFPSYSPVLLPEEYPFWK